MPNLKHGTTQINPREPNREEGMEQQLTELLALLRMPAMSVRERTWQKIQTRIVAQTQTSTNRFRQQSMRLVIGFALVLAFMIVGVSPLGHEAVAAGRSLLAVVFGSVMKTGPDGQTTPVPAIVVGSSIISVEELVSLPEAEQQAGFPARVPQYLPDKTHLLGAKTIVSNQSSPEGRRIQLTYLVGDQGQHFTLVQSRNLPEQQPTYAQQVQIGSNPGWIQSCTESDMPCYAVTWKDGEDWFWLAGALPSEQFIRIAESIPTIGK
ncbi:hypothetical protein HC891_16990 [Candidatus Gracilibacteria bacterium]|nr:hypothetical protein [Candidatus Gracilibacteria bacterium]